MDSHAKGKCAELLVLSKLMREEHQIAIPFGNQGGWDCLVEEDDKWMKYQIKSTRKRKRCINKEIDCRRSYVMRRDPPRREYKKGDFDFMIAVDIETQEMWRIPAKDIIRRTSIALTNKYVWL